MDNKLLSWLDLNNKDINILFPKLESNFRKISYFKNISKNDN